MLNKPLVLPLALLFLLAPAPASAAGKVAAGAAKAEDCASCHGADGNSTATTFPKLAGQYAGYLFRQLKDFKDGERNAPMMAALASGLDEQSMHDLAAYYAIKVVSNNLPPTLANDDDDDDGDDSDDADTPATAEANAVELQELLAMGNNLYRNGNLKTKVAACTACHGPNAEGNKPSAFPALKSQHADYMIKTLSDFKQGTRSNLPNNMMRAIAQKMTAREIQAVSLYLSTLR